MAETIFRDNSIQTGHRIKIPKAIVDTLGLEVGQKIEVRFDAEKGTMVVEASK